VTASPGSAAEEAVKLLAAAEAWARDRAGHLLDDDGLATGARECTVCPLCQAVGAVRSVHPDVLTHLLDAAASAVAALRAAVVPPPGPSASSAPRVQHIDLDDSDDTAQGRDGSGTTWG
jgi:hypothetical protein